MRVDINNINWKKFIDKKAVNRMFNERKRFYNSVKRNHDIDKKAMYIIKEFTKFVIGELLNGRPVSFDALRGLPEWYIFNSFVPTYTEFSSLPKNVYKKVITSDRKWGKAFRINVVSKYFKEKFYLIEVHREFLNEFRKCINETDLCYDIKKYA